MAQIVTITNPLTGQPAQVDQLDHTSQEIDDATTRALEGGAIDQLLAGKAPAGYGLGGIGKQQVTDMNNAKESGFYSAIGSTNLPPNVESAQHGSVLVLCSQAERVTQVYFHDVTGGTGAIAVRRLNGNGWSQWEFINPPMRVGVEYRTIERYNGNVVTRKLVNCGAMANAKTVELADNSKYRIISANVRVGSDPMPYWHNGAVGTGNTTNVWNAYFNIVSTSIILYCGSSAAEAAQTVLAEVRMIPA